MPRHHLNISTLSASSTSVVGCAALPKEGAWLALGFDYFEMLLLGFSLEGEGEKDIGSGWHMMVQRSFSSLQSCNAAVGPLNDSQNFKCLLLKDPWAKMQQSLPEMEAQSLGGKGSSTVVGSLDCVVTNWLQKWWSPLREVIVWGLQGKKIGFWFVFFLLSVKKMTYPHSEEEGCDGNDSPAGGLTAPISTWLNTLLF